MWHPPVQSYYCTKGVHIEHKDFNNCAQNIIFCNEIILKNYDTYCKFIQDVIGLL